MDFVEKFRFDDSNLKRLKELVKANLVNATLDKRKEADRLKKHINMLSEKQTGIIKKNLDGVIPDNVLKQQLNIIERELTEAHASLLCFPEVEIDFLGALAFVEDYLKSPGKIWRNAKLGVQIKLQWFQFPSGLVFENNFFGTTEMSRFFKVKMLFDDAKSSKVDPRRFELLTFALQKHCSTS
jgi:hypothetical protein